MTHDSSKFLMGPKVVDLAGWKAEQKKVTVLRRLFRETPAFIAAIKEHRRRKEAAGQSLATRLQTFDALFDSVIQRFSEDAPNMPVLDRDRQILKNIGEDIKEPVDDAVGKYVDNMLNSLDGAWSARFLGDTLPES